MKKCISILVFIFFIFNFAYADSELVFQNIPWLSDDVSTLRTLTDAGFIRDGVSFLTLTNDNAVYIVEDDTGFIIPDKVMGAEDVTFTADLTGIIKGKIAGCPVKDLKMTFAYDGEYKLIAVQVELINASFDGLKNKLIKAYGEGEMKETEEGIQSVVWKGANNSGAVLYTQSAGLDYTLIYGRLDATDILSKCLEGTDSDDVAGL